MSDRVRVVTAVLAKDLRSFARDPFYVTVSAIGLVFYVAIFWLLPAEVDETVRLGLYSPDLAGVGAAEADAPALGGLAALPGAGGLAALPGTHRVGLAVTPFSTRTALESAVRDDAEVVAGVVLPVGFLASRADPTRPAAAGPVELLVTADTPTQLHQTLAALVRELVSGLGGAPSPVVVPDLATVVVGRDRSGQQPTLRVELLPLLLFLVLLVEMFAVAALISVEVHQGTLTALLVTPARIADVLAAKTLLGAALAGGQGLLLLAATLLATGSLATAERSAATAVGVLVLALLLGSVLITGVAMITGSLARDFVGIVFLGVLLLVPLAAPSFAVLLPGAAPPWVQLLPTFPLVAVIAGVVLDGDGLIASLPDLALLAGWCVVSFGVGVLVLQQRRGVGR